MDIANSSNSSIADHSCLDYINDLNRDHKPYQTLSLLVPTNDVVWTERSDTWVALFKAAIVLLAILYLTVGLVSAVLLVKKNALRLKTRTFFAVYLSMAVLGFSRAALLILDPYGILGYISDQFPAWIIISRFLATGGFPSIIAATTLIILTLVKLVNAGHEAQWYEKWGYVLTLLVIPYIIALLAEAIGHTDTYPAIFSGLLCETLFVFWGLLICIAYLAAGTRLLREVQKLHRNATMVSEVDHNQTRPTSAEIKARDKKTKKIAQKIVIITFGTAITGIVYSVVSAGAVVMVLLLVFLDCMGSNSRTNSPAWLVVQCVNYVTEIAFASLILYSITDVSLLVSFVKFLVTCQPCRSCTSVGMKESLSQSQDMSTPTNGARLEEGEAPMRKYSRDAGHQGNQFVLTTNKNSGSSIDSEDNQNTFRRNMVTSYSHDDIIQSPESQREDRRSQPIDLDTISNVLSIGDDVPPPWLSRKLKRNRGSDPTLVKSENSSLPLRHCQSHTPYHRPQHLSPLTSPISPTILLPHSQPAYSQSHPLHPESHQRT